MDDSFTLWCRWGGRAHFVIEQISIRNACKIKIKLEKNLAPWLLANFAWMLRIADIANRNWNL
jgi:hypothetical protein